jgi:hypothetical protein
LCPKSKVNVNVFTLSDKVKILDLWKVQSLVEIGRHYGKKINQVSTIQNSTLHPQRSWVFLSCKLLGPYTLNTKDQYDIEYYYTLLFHIMCMTFPMAIKVLLKQCF